MVLYGMFYKWMRVFNQNQRQGMYMKQTIHLHTLAISVAGLVSVVELLSPAFAGPISFSNFVLDPGSGIHYTRTRSTGYAEVQALQQSAPPGPGDHSAL